MKYFKASVEEIKKVTWPTKKHAIQITVVTIIFTAVTTAALTFVDEIRSMKSLTYMTKEGS